MNFTFIELYNTIQVTPTRVRTVIRVFVINTSLHVCLIHIQKVYYELEKKYEPQYNTIQSQWFFSY